MTKKEAKIYFETSFLPAIRETYEKDGRTDAVARSQEWSNFTDYLYSMYKITKKQYDSWFNPY